MRCYRTDDHTARYRDRLALKAEDDGFDVRHGKTVQGPTTCYDQGKNIAQPGA